MTEADTNVKQAQVELLAAQQGAAKEEIDQAEVTVNQAKVELMAAREKLKAAKEQLQNAGGG